MNYKMCYNVMHGLVIGTRYSLLPTEREGTRIDLLISGILSVTAMGMGS